MRRALAGVWAILPLALLLLLVAALPAPERVPTHWTGRTPDGWSSGPGFTSAILTTTAVCAVLAALTSVLQRMVPPAWGRWILTVAAAVGWCAVLVYAVTVWRVGVDGPDQVREWWALLAIVGGLAAGAVGYLLHGRRRPTREDLDDLVPERSRVQPIRGAAVRPVALWETVVSSTTLRVVGWGLIGLFVVVCLAIALVGESWTLVLLLAVTGLGSGALALAWSSVVVQVDADRLLVRGRTVPLPVTTVPVEEIAGADVQDLDPMRWGGIGLRILPDRTAYIAGPGGPGLVVYRRDGRRLALQITEGEQVARAGARTVLQAAGQRRGEDPASS